MNFVRMLKLTQKAHSVEGSKGLRGPEHAETGWKREANVHSSMVRERLWKKLLSTHCGSPKHGNL